MTAATANPVVRPLAILLRIAALIVTLGGVAWLMLTLGLPYVAAVAAGASWRGAEWDELLRAVVANLSVIFFLSAVAEVGNILHRVAAGEVAGARNRAALIAVGVMVALGIAAPHLAPVLFPAYA